ncbi:MAG TPA: adenylate/guanylate cyclase domain-containing protein [Acidimicrobiales bacterium]|nr:adenylate/guanylate cyclase domain-containing protein [Acidimicrobiales bacterium]
MTHGGFAGSSSIPYTLPTETLTFLFTDIEGSTRLLGRLGHATYGQVLADHHRLIRSRLAAHDGKEIVTQGDGFFAVFSSPSACVAAVIEMQQALGTHEWPDAQAVRVRMGVHCGEATEMGTGLVGLDVHRAARIAAVAHGGQIVLSGAAAALVRDSLPVHTSLRDLGYHRLKDLGRPEQIFQLEAEGLESDFPPLSSLDNPSLVHNLPAQSTVFVGRDREVQEVRRLVETTRLVTLTGAGGSGKTRLALHVAAELLDGSGDGVWLVELAPLSDPDAVASTISSVLGIATQAGRPALETLVDALVPQRILLVLDNCEHLIGDCAKVADVILRRCPEVHLITTSREPLGIGGETIYRVPSLSLPATDEEVVTAVDSDAVKLFVERARGQGVDLVLDAHTGPLVVSICRRLDGMPLAIELAAARMRSLSLSSLYDRLDQRFRLLTGGSRSALPRQQTLRATVDWSYSLLSAPERSVLQRLSVFAEGFDLEAAESVCGLGDIDAFDVTDLVGSLVDKSLVVAESVGDAIRYRMLETIRQFGAEQLVGGDESAAGAVRAAHCAYYLSVAEQAAPHLTGSEQGPWLARLSGERANLRRAMEHTVADPNGTELILRFGVALRRYWWVHSRSEAIDLLVPALRHPDAERDPDLYCAALITAAYCARSVDIATSRYHAELAVETARRYNRERYLAESLNILCAVCYFAGDPETGFAFGREGVERARQLGDDALLGEGLAMYLLCCKVVEPERAEELFVEAIACTQRTGDHFLAYVLENNAAVHALDEGDIRWARAHLERANEAGEMFGTVSPNVTVNLGWVLREEGDAAGAGNMFEKALAMARRNGDRSSMAYANLGLACLAGDQGDWHRAAVLHGVAQAFLDQTGEIWVQPEHRYSQDSLDQVRAGLDADEFQRAFVTGRGLSTKEAVELTLPRYPST